MGQKQQGQQKEEKELPDFSQVENGPRAYANRQCRDVCCCLLFNINFIAMVAMAIYGYSAGNLDKIFRGTAENQVCGLDATALYPYMYFYNPLPYSTAGIDTTKRVCVQTCPQFIGGVLTVPVCATAPTTGAASCNFDMTFAEDGTPSDVPAPNDFIGYNSAQQLGRICVPTADTFINAFNRYFNSSTVDSSSFANIFDQSYLADFTYDIQNNWPWLLCGAGFAIVISFIYLFMLRCFVGCIVWISLIGTLFLLIGLGVIFLFNAGLFGDLTTVGALGLPTFATQSQYYEVYGWICIGLAGVYLILLLCCCSRIRLAVAVCNVAGQFVVRVYLIILVPIFMTIFQVALWGLCLAAMAYLISSANFVIIDGDILTGIADYTQNNLIMFYYFFFATLWTNAFLGAMSIFIVASACCMWYFSHGAGEDLDSPISSSVKMVFRYHWGSLAFGAFILAVVQFLQFIVEIFKKQAEASGQDKAPCFEYVINCLRCCLACVERIVQFLNKTAYIQIALQGKNFCMAAKDGFEIVWSNGLRYAIVTGVGQIIMFMGRLFIAIGSAAAFYALITFEASIATKVMQPIFLILIVFLIAFVIATIFMSVYSVAIDTLLACFIVDEINQKAKGGKAPLYAPSELAELMDRDDGCCPCC